MAGGTVGIGSIGLIGFIKRIAKKCQELKRLTRNKITENNAMPKFRKGMPRPAKAGRRAGTANRVNAEFKAAIADLLAGNVPKFQGWLDQVAADDPAKAFAIVIKLMEFVLPKLHRVEFVDGRQAQPVQVEVKWV